MKRKIKVLPTYYSSNNIGNKVIDNAVRQLYKGISQKSYFNVIAGLEMITSDSKGIVHRLFLRNKIPAIFEDKNSNNVVDFLKAFCYSRYCEHNVDLLEQGLKSINKYLEMRPCKYGYYIQGSILLSLERLDRAHSSFLNSKKNGNLKCNNYKIGLLKMNMKKEFGLIELLNAFLENPEDFYAKLYTRNYWLDLINKDVLSVHDFNSEDKSLEKDFFTEESNFDKRYTEEVLHKEPVLEFLALTNSKDKGTASFFLFLEENLQNLILNEESITNKIIYLDKENEKRKAYKEQKTNRENYDSTDYEEAVMRALSRGNGDKLGY